MPEPTVTCAGEVLAEAAMTMAFVSLEPIGQPIECGADMRRIRIALKGAPCAAVELLAPEALGALLVGNMLACDPSDPTAVAGAADALKELVNVITGDLLRRMELVSGSTEMGLPMIDSLDDAAEVQHWLDAGHCDLFDAEGHVVAIRLTEGN